AFIKKKFNISTIDKNCPVAFICQTDQIALGAIKAVKETSYKIPDDISIIGFGDISTSRFSDPALTTISVPKREMGKIGAENFLKLLEDKKQSGACILLESILIIRNSTKNNI
ncbi:MAG: substrate-binding domain-containing protein, partial [Actinobacteria bacterium]|nr:substrate-binding domain-containing protein [Actinomycetota bacterium]